MDLGVLRRWLPGGRPRSAPDGSAAGGPAEGAAPIPASLSGSDWRRLPALHGVIGPAPLVARSRGYERELAGGRGTPLALQRLGHDRGLDAPAGLVTAAATPLQRVPDEPVPSSVRSGRRERSRVAAKLPTQAPGTSVLATPTGPAARPPVQTDVADDVAHPSPQGDSSSVAPEPSTPERLATQPMPLPDPGPSLVRAPRVSPAPVGIIGDLGTAGVGAAGHRTGTDDATDRPTTIPGAGVQAGSPVASGSSPAVARSPVDTVVAARAPAPTRSDPTSIGREGRSSAAAQLPPASKPGGPTVARTHGPVRRTRLGAPIDTPTRMDAPRPPAGAPSVTGPAGGPPGRGVQRDAAGSTPGADGATTVGAGAAGTALHHGVWDLVPGPDHVPLRADPAAVPIRPISVARQTAPLVGTLRPALDLGSPAVAIRSPSETADVEAGPEPGTPAAALAALAAFDPFGAAGSAPEFAGGVGHRPASLVAADGAAPPSAGIAGADAGQGELGDASATVDISGQARWSTPSRSPVGVSRSIAAQPEPGPRGSSMPRRTLETRAATLASLPAAIGARPTVLRLAPAARPTGPEAAGTAGGRTPTAGPSASAHDTPSTLDQASDWSDLSAGPRITSWSADDAPTSLSGRSVGRASMPAMAALQRSVDAGPQPVGTILPSRPVQRAEEDAAPAETTPPTGGEAAGATGASAGAAPGTTPGPSARELDELAGKLYEPLRRRLHRELLVDRERDGSLLSLGR